MALLTRVPVGGRRPADPKNSTMWFPVVGSAIGLCAAGVYASALFLFSAFIAAALAVGAGIVVTGAFHEDGLADTADAFWGGSTREQRLEILKDPRIGAFGALAILFSVLLRIFALASLDSLTALGALVGAHTLSRTAVILALGWFSPAAEGLGSLYARATSARRIAMGVALGGLVAVTALHLWSLPAAGLAMCACLGVGLIGHRKVGGITGDVLGAVEQVAEVSILLLLSAGPGIT